ncbi:unannotated protein [freshwater metagenome]|uniref:Unannotated protein n=1 Tax=freshwater metagenome TaxID=449393 RepID=A0A6J7FW37_9ZZZZ
MATGRPVGHYGYSALLGPRIRGVPVAAAAAWAMMARPSWVAGGWAVRGVRGRRRRRVLHVAAASAALTAWDVFLDPRMVREGYWTWPGGGRYAGVPASNFAGWFATSAVVFGTWAALGAGEPDARDDEALALYAWTWAGETFANLALWRQPLVAAAGSTAMGLVLVPAVRGRRAATDAAVPAAAPAAPRSPFLVASARRRLRTVA